jgi:hypothetical protein
MNTQPLIRMGCSLMAASIVGGSCAWTSQANAQPIEEPRVSDPATPGAPVPTPASTDVSRGPEPTSNPSSAPLSPGAAPSGVSYPVADTYVHAPPPQRTYASLSLGLRVGVLRDAGLDPFASTDTLGQSALAASGTVWARAPFSIAATAGWDYGSRADQARGINSKISVHRVSAGARAGWDIANVMTVYARVAPGAMHLVASLDDTTTGVTQSARPWTWSLDLAGGVLLPIANLGTSTFPVHVLGIFEGGYGFAGRADLTFSPDLPDGDRRRVTSTSLPSFSPHGGFFSFGAGLAL